MQQELKVNAPSCQVVQNLDEESSMNIELKIQSQQFDLFHQTNVGSANPQDQKKLIAQCIGANISNKANNNFNNNSEDLFFKRRLLQQQYTFNQKRSSKNTSGVIQESKALSQIRVSTGNQLQLPEQKYQLNVRRLNLRLNSHSKAQSISSNSSLKAAANQKKSNHYLHPFNGINSNSRSWQRNSQSNSSQAQNSKRNSIEREMKNSKGMEAGGGVGYCSGTPSSAYYIEKPNSDENEQENEKEIVVQKKKKQPNRKEQDPFLILSLANENAKKAVRKVARHNKSQKLEDVTFSAINFPRSLLPQNRLMQSKLSQPITYNQQKLQDSFNQDDSNATASTQMGSNYNSEKQMNLMSKSKGISAMSFISGDTGLIPQQLLQNISLQNQIDQKFFSQAYQGLPQNSCLFNNDSPQREIYSPEKLDNQSLDKIQITDAQKTLQYQNGIEDPYYFYNYHGIKDSHRIRLINWMIQVFRVLEKKEIRTFMLAVQFLDRYFMLKCIQQVKLDKQHLHITALAAIFIASKLEDSYHIGIEEIVFEAGHSKYEKTEIFQKEYDILGTLKFKLIEDNHYEQSCTLLKQILIDNDDIVLSNRDHKELFTFLGFISQLVAHKLELSQIKLEYISKVLVWLTLKYYKNSCREEIYKSMNESALLVKDKSILINHEKADDLFHRFKKQISLDFQNTMIEESEYQMYEDYQQNNKMGQQQNKEYIDSLQQQYQANLKIIKTQVIKFYEEYLDQLHIFKNLIKNHPNYLNQETFQFVKGKHETE